MDLERGGGLPLSFCPALAPFTRRPPGLSGAAPWSPTGRQAPTVSSRPKRWEFAGI